MAEMVNLQDAVRQIYEQGGSEADVQAYLGAQGFQAVPAGDGGAAPTPEQAAGYVPIPAPVMPPVQPGGGAPRMDPNAAALAGGLGAGVMGAPVALATGPWAPAAELGIVTLGAQLGRETARLWNEHVAGDTDPAGLGERLARTGQEMATDATLGAGGAGLMGAPKAIGGFLRRAIGGGTEESAAALRAFRDANVEPTLGAVGGRTAQGTEKALQKMPFSTGLMDKAVSKARGQLAGEFERVKGLGGRSVIEQETAGEGVRKSVKGWVESRKAYFEDAYRFVPGLSRVKVDLGDLQQLAREVIEQEGKGMGDEAAIRLASRAFQRKTVDPKGIVQTVPRDGQIPFEEAVKLRSDWLNIARSGKEEVAGAAEKAAQRLAGALDEAMARGARQGVADGLLTANSFQEWRGLNAQYKGYREQLAQVASIARSETGEQAFRLAFAGAGDGPSRLRAIKAIVPEDAWADMATYKLGQIGLERPGKAVGTTLEFSPETYLTNLNALRSEGTRAELFGAKGSEWRDAVEKLGELAGRLKDANFMANPSGTAGQSHFMTLFSVGGGGTAGLLAASGHPLLGAAQLTAQFGGAPAMAKLFTSPRFIGWFADAGRIPATDAVKLAAHMAILPRVVGASPELREAAGTYLDAVQLALPPSGEAAAAAGKTAAPGGIRGQLQSLGQRLGYGRKARPAPAGKAGTTGTI